MHTVVHPHGPVRPRPPRVAPRRDSSTGLGSLVRFARAGDQQAWNELVRRFDGMLRAVAKRYRLSSADVDDVVQVAWIRAYCNLSRLNEPTAIGGWLVVTTRREALRRLQRGVREVLTDELPVTEQIEIDPTERLAFENERDAALRQAVRRLTGRQRSVLRTLLERPEMTYSEISEMLEMPIGSIGPTRDRGLANLRQDHQLACAMSQHSA